MIIPIIQSIVAILLIAAVMLQQKGTALGSAFGGGDGGSGGSYSTKRGLEKKLYWATIILGAIFIVLSILNLII